MGECKLHALEELLRHRKVRLRVILDVVQDFSKHFKLKKTLRCPRQGGIKPLAVNLFVGKHEGVVWRIDPITITIAHSRAEVKSTAVGVLEDLWEDFFSNALNEDHLPQLGGQIEERESIHCCRFRREFGVQRGSDGSQKVLEVEDVDGGELRSGKWRLHEKLSLKSVTRRYADCNRVTQAGSLKLKEIASYVYRGKSVEIG